MKEGSKIAEAYLNEYSDTVEALPLELQRNYTLIRQLDETAEDIMTQVAKESEGLSSERMALLKIEERRAKLERIGQLLNEVLKKGEEKFALAKSTYDTVDRHCTRLDVDLQKIEDEQLGPGRSDGTNNSQKKLKSAMTNSTADKKRRDSEIQKPSVGRGRKRLKKDEEEEEDETTEGDTYLSTEDAIQHAKNAVSMSDLPIDPNEPLYCYCRQVSFGEMVACDNEACDIEWFHLECVGLTVVPKGKWYCKNCANEFKKKKKL